MSAKLRNIGPKSAAWLRQVGVRSAEDLAALGAVAAFVKVKRAGFKPSLNLLYSLEGALRDCHWQELPEDVRQQLVAAYDTAAAALPPARGTPTAAPVHERYRRPEEATSSDDSPIADDAEADDEAQTHCD